MGDGLMNLSDLGSIASIIGLVLAFIGAYKLIKIKNSSKKNILKSFFHIGDNNQEIK
jgi:uncharacterized membrane protein